MKQNPKNSIGSFSADAMDNRLIGIMRVLLSLSALIIIYVDPTEPDRLVEITYTVLVLYFVYSLVLYYLAVKHQELIPARFIHWIDLVWYLAFISLSSGTSSIFFFFFFFSILVTSFLWGYRSGLYFTFVSTVLFTVIGFSTSPAGVAFELNRFLLRPIYLSIFGYLIAFWGGREITSKKRLLLLRDINQLSNPRLGTEQTFELMMSQLLRFFDAKSCSIITVKSLPDEFVFRQIDSNSKWSFEVKQSLSPLIRVPERFGLLFADRSFYDLFEGKTDRMDLETGQRDSVSKSEYKIVSDLLEAPYFITVPISLHGELYGRVYLTSDKNIFELSDLEFLNQAVAQIMVTLQNIQLLDKMASVATVQQRKKISRDIHDSIVQPFIGLKLGLEALEIKYSDLGSVKDDIQKIKTLADSNINDLRGYIRKLNSPDGAETGSVLLTAVREQTARFVELYGVETEICANENFHLNDRLSAEVFQIVVEGINNIVKHSKSNRVLLNFKRDAAIFTLEIINPVEERSAAFSPRSIISRTEDLGGTVSVSNTDTETKVTIEIPL